MAGKVKRWYIRTVIANLRDAEAFLRELCGGGIEFEADLALAFAALALHSRSDGARSTEDYLSGFPGLARTVSAYSTAKHRFPAAIEAMISVARNLSGRELGLLYETCRHERLVANEGSVYTPFWLADELSREASAHRGGRVLDPACGAGIFLLATLDAAEGPALETLRGLFGVDRDPDAVQICRAALLLDSARTVPRVELPKAAAIVERNIRLGDTLINRDLLADAAPFDSVIGNPPYGLSRDLRIDPAEKEELMRLYGGARTGKMNKYLLFMARGF